MVQRVQVDVGKELARQVADGDSLPAGYGGEQVIAIKKLDMGSSNLVQCNQRVKPFDET